VVDESAEISADGPTPRLDPPAYVRRLFDTKVGERERVIDEMRREIEPVGALAIIKVDADL
jgi:hypothetical protein